MPESAAAVSADRTTAKDAAAPDRSGVMTIPVSQTAVEVLPTDSAESGDSSVMLRMSELRTVRAAAEMATEPVTAENGDERADKAPAKGAAKGKRNRYRMPLVVLGVILFAAVGGILVWISRISRIPYDLYDFPGYCLISCRRALFSWPRQKWPRG